MTQSKKNTKRKRYLVLDWWTFSAIFLVALGIAAVFFPWTIVDGLEPIKGYKLRTKDYGDLATFITGVSTPLFGLATILMLVRAYDLQKQQLQEAKEGMEDQVKILQKQRFEDNFFRLLENHHRIVQDMDLHGKNTAGEKVHLAKGRDCFRTFHRHMKGKINELEMKRQSEGEELTIEDVDTIYDETQEYYKADLHHYFRFIYHILKFVKSSEGIEEEDKYKYTSILRANFSPYELALIFYNCLHEFGNSHFKPLVEEFSFLKNRHRELLFIKSQEAAYHDLAFAKSEDRPALLKNWKKEQEKKKLEQTTQDNQKELTTEGD